MNAIQLRAYEAPVTHGRSVAEGQHNHSEVYGDVPVSVLLTADIGHVGEERFGRRGVWHCSVAVWTGFDKQRIYVMRNTWAEVCWRWR